MVFLYLYFGGICSILLSEINKWCNNQVELESFIILLGGLILLGALIPFKFWGEVKNTKPMLIEMFKGKLKSG